MASDVSHSKFSAREVHRIGILDIRILNTDRNDANILVVEPWTEGGAMHDSMHDSMGAVDGRGDGDGGDGGYGGDGMGGVGGLGGVGGMGGVGGVGGGGIAGIAESVAASEEWRLVPIDHGYCLPTNLEVGWCDWCWYDWPQAKVRSLSYLVHLF